MWAGTGHRDSWESSAGSQACPAHLSEAQGGCVGHRQPSPLSVSKSSPRYSHEVDGPRGDPNLRFHPRKPRVGTAGGPAQPHSHPSLRGLPAARPRPHSRFSLGECYPSQVASLCLPGSALVQGPPAPEPSQRSQASRALAMAHPAHRPHGPLTSSGVTLTGTRRGRRAADKAVPASRGGGV